MTFIFTVMMITGLRSDTSLKDLSHISHDSKPYLCWSFKGASSTRSS
jgi:hypothetical protein